MSFISFGRRRRMDQDGSRWTLKQWFGDLNLDVILRLVAGKRFYGGGGKGADAAMTRGRKCLGISSTSQGCSCRRTPSSYLGWLDIGGYEKKMKENSRELDRIVGGWLAVHKENEHSNKDKPQDFMDVMLSVLQGAKFRSEYDTDTIIKATCESLIAGASDTTSIISMDTFFHVEKSSCPQKSSR